MFRRAIPLQLELLVTAIEKCPMLIHGKFCKILPHETQQTLWINIANRLNNILGGAQKSELQWRKTWSSIKISTREKVRQLREEAKANDGENQIQTTAKVLSPLEQRIITLIERTCLCEISDSTGNNSNALPYISPSECISESIAVSDMSQTSEQNSEHLSILSFLSNNSEDDDDVQNLTYASTDDSDHSNSPQSKTFILSTDNEKIRHNINSVKIKIEPNAEDISLTTPLQNENTVKQLRVENITSYASTIPESQSENMCIQRDIAESLKILIKFQKEANDISRKKMKLQEASVAQDIESNKLTKELIAINKELLQSIQNFKEERCKKYTNNFVSDQKLTYTTSTEDSGNPDSPQSDTFILPTIHSDIGLIQHKINPVKIEPNIEDSSFTISILDEGATNGRKAENNVHDHTTFQSQSDSLSIQQDISESLKSLVEFKNEANDIYKINSQGMELSKLTKDTANEELLQSVQIHNEERYKNFPHTNAILITMHEDQNEIPIEPSAALHIMKKTAKSPAERARDYRARKKALAGQLQDPSSPRIKRPKTSSERVREFRARQKMFAGLVQTQSSL